MKVRILHGGICTYEIQIKKSWFSPWVTLYDGILPWRAILKKLRTFLIN